MSTQMITFKLVFHRAGFLPILLFFLVFGAVQIQANELEKAVTDLSADNRGDITTAIETLTELGDSAVLPALQALLQGQLRKGEKGRSLILSEDEKTLTDALNGKAQPAEGLELEKPRINNRVRRALKAAIAKMELFSPDATLRRKAAQRLVNKPDEDAETVINQALAKETDTDIQEILQLALARLTLNSEDPAKRLKAIEALAENGGPSSSAQLKELLAVDEDGAFEESDVKVRDAAEKAIASIRSRQDFIDLIRNLLYGTSMGSILLLAALGLAITFGLIGVINMAHGEMLMLGAYSTYVVQQAFAAWAPGFMDAYLIVALPVAFIVSAMVGMAMERSVIRFLYGRPLETLLATWGLSLIIIQTVRLIFGAQNVAVANPTWLSGGLTVAQGLVLPYSRIAMVVFSLSVVIMIWLLLQRTRLGLELRAVTQNRGMAASVGVRTQRVDMWAFGLGSGVAGLGGVALSQLGNVGPELGQGYIVDSFMVVVLGGVGKLAGAVSGAFGLGVLTKFLEPATDAVLAKIIVLGLIILFIQKRPQGLFALKGRSVEH